MTTEQPKQFPLPLLLSTVNSVLQWAEPYLTRRRHHQFAFQMMTRLTPVVTNHFLKLENEQMEIKKGQVKEQNTDISEQDLLKKMTEYEAGLTPYINRLIQERVTAITFLACKDAFPTIYAQHPAPPEPPVPVSPAPGDPLYAQSQQPETQQAQNGEPQITIVQEPVQEGQPEVVRG